MTNALTRTFNSLVGRLESAQGLDRISDKVASVLQRLFPPGPISDLVGGTPIGHPVHPPLTALTIGSWTAATILDLTGADATAARRLTGFGVLAAIPTALSGAHDWLTTAEAERRVGLAHAALNDTALSLYLFSWLARRKGQRARGAALGLLGGAALTAGGALGGHLAYALGVGVDTTAFQRLPADWTDVAASGDVPVDAPTAVAVSGVPILLARDGERIVAMADRCTHRGGPLHEGTIQDGCVVCPWHGSRFDLADGAVAGGPAVRPQSVLQVRTVAGRLQVRRAAEPRALRTRPTGV